MGIINVTGAGNNNEMRWITFAMMGVIKSFALQNFWRKRYGTKSWNGHSLPLLHCSYSPQTKNNPNKTLNQQTHIIIIIMNANDMIWLLPCRSLVSLPLTKPEFYGRQIAQANVDVYTSYTYTTSRYGFKHKPKTIKALRESISVYVHFQQIGSFSTKLMKFEFVCMIFGIWYQRIGDS